MRKVLTVLLLSTLAIGTASAETLHFGTTTANPPFVTANGKISPLASISIRARPVPADAGAVPVHGAAFRYPDPGFYALRNLTR